MAKTPPKKGPGRPPNPDNVAGRWSVYLSRKYRAAVEDLASEAKRSARAEIELALEAWLKSKGKTW
jgi:hypothetical protein